MEEVREGANFKRKLRHSYMEDEENPEEAHGYKMRKEEGHDSPRFVDSGSINVNFYPTSDEGETRRFSRSGLDFISDRLLFK